VRDADRTVLSTDNSIYQRLPQAVLCPAHVEDVMLLGRLLSQPSYREIKAAPRGGGTGTNGQSLTDGIVVDLSRNMNAISRSMCSSAGCGYRLAWSRTS
jgi:FAD/FMN-containing dehydrogenase